MADHKGRTTFANAPTGPVILNAKTKDKMMTKCAKPLLLTALLYVCGAAESSAQVRPAADDAPGDKFQLAGKDSGATLYYDDGDFEVVKRAAGFLSQDIGLVTGREAIVRTLPADGEKTIVVIGTLGRNRLIDDLVAKGRLNVDKIRSGWEQYAVEVVDRPTPGIRRALVIAGCDRRGTAYGVFSVSEAIGVDPWYWWADVPVKKRSAILLAVKPFRSERPSVKYRGLFINDEDFGLKPWAAKTFDPALGDIGPKTYSKICELLLRLKGNYLCPAMHSCTKAFNHYPDNKLVADSLAIVMGSVHCEPLLFNNASEWNRKTMGEWNYTTNKDGINKVLRRRVEENGVYENVYSLAMRGIHDAVMAGNLTLGQQARVLEKAFDDQRQILSEVLGKPADRIPQAFTPYKEVLHTYEHGMTIPEDVTLVWGDDDFGYMKRLSNAAEQKRSGRSGVYYHLSYWGPPMNFLWLNTNPPVQMYTELKKAYDTSADGIWLANAGDIKPAENALSLFLDMAWDIDAFTLENVGRYYAERMSKHFGREHYDTLLHIFDEYFSLAFARKPEHMQAHMQEQFEQDNYREAARRTARYACIADEAERIYAQLDEASKPGFFELVRYPVQGAALLNIAILEAQRNRWYAAQGRVAANQVRDRVNAAVGKLREITREYNELKDGKWRYMMTLAQGGWGDVYVPPTLQVTPAAGAGLGIHAESETSGTGMSSLHTLPCFNPYTDKTYYIDLFNTGGGELKWSARSSEPWLRLDRTAGSTAFEQRINVCVDWDKAPAGRSLRADILIEGAGGKETVFVSAFNPREIVRDSLAGLYVEDNGVVSIDAAGFHRKFERQGIVFDKITRYGYEDTVVRLGDPVARADYYPALELNSNWVAPGRLDRYPMIEYDFYSFTTGPVDVYTYMVPLFPLDDEHGTRYGVMVDNSPVYLPEAGAPYYSTLWVQSILRNCRVNKTTHLIGSPGKHTVRIFAAHPGMMLQKIVIDFGGMKRSYLGPLPTKVEPRIRTTTINDNR